VQRVEERLAERARRGGAAAVQEHERPVAVLLRHDPDLVEVATDEMAVQRVVLDPRPAGSPVAADHVANDDVGRDGHDGYHG